MFTLSSIPGYRVEVDQIKKEQWFSLLSLFDDASFMQTWDFAEIVCPSQQVSRLILSRQREVVGLAQVRIITFPLLKRGVAYVTWGPIWRRRGTQPDLQIFEAMLVALKEEYVVRRKLLLRLLPYIIKEEGMELASGLTNMGFNQVTHTKQVRTIIVNISRPLPEIRKALRKKWRQYLNQAEQNSLEVRQGTSLHLYDEFLPIYFDLLKHKGFRAAIDTKRLRTLQEVLPDAEKPHVFLIYHKGKAISGLIVSSIGNTGIAILGAANSYGRKLCSSYLMQWRAIEWFKEMGCQYYDLMGIDPKKNPGTYQFKRGFRGHEVSLIGLFENCQSPLSRMIVRLGEPMRKIALKFIRKK